MSVICMAEFETRMSSKGQVVIAKKIREEMGIRPNQRFIEKREGGKIVLAPVTPLSKAGGILKDMDKRSTKEIIKELKTGWE